ncbi:MAG: glycosyltransferase [Desulfovibrio sp.]|nr:glycosyltransferase [Desulfovibrio sp.]
MSAYTSHVPCVSVIMNCRNSSKDLAQALDSLMAQTFTDFEVVFYDNASTDESPTIAKSYGEKIHYVRGQDPVPLGAARNLAIREVRGEFIAFLDCDDLWRPEKLERQVACFRQDNQIGLVCTDTVLFDGKRELGRVFAGSQPARGMVFAELMQRQWISMSSAMIRREALKSLGEEARAWTGGWFDETLNVCEEADVFYRIAHDWKLDYVDEALTLWRIHGGNTTFKHFGQFADETLYILQKQRALYPNYDHDYADLVRLLTRRANFQKAIDLWHHNHAAQARELLRAIKEPSLKHRLFFFVSFLPGSCFDLLARIYFSLPASLRR